MGILWSRPVLYVTQETFLVQFLGPTGAIKTFVEPLIELFWSHQKNFFNGKHTDEKP